MTVATPFLMFQGGVGREAVEFYVCFSTMARSSTSNCIPRGCPPRGHHHRGRFRIAGQTFLVSDSFVDDEFGFTPSLSVWIDAETADAQEALVTALGEGGDTLMPLGSYGVFQQVCLGQRPLRRVMASESGR